MDYRRERQQALEGAAGDRATASEALKETVESLAVNGDVEAEIVCDRMMLAGFRQDIDQFATTREGRLVIAIAGQSTTVPAAKSVHRRRPDATIEQLALPMLDLQFAEIRQKIEEMGNQYERLFLGIRTLDALLKLETKLAEHNRILGTNFTAATPREALRHLGVSAEDWLQAI